MQKKEDSLFLELTDPLQRYLPAFHVRRVLLRMNIRKSREALAMTFCLEGQCVCVCVILLFFHIVFGSGLVRDSLWSGKMEETLVEG